MTILNRQNLLAATSAASTGSWYPLDWRLDPGGVVRTITGTLTVGDTCILEATNEAIYDSSGVAVSVSVIASVTSFTTTPFVGQFSGQYSAVRIRKTGTTGPAIVNGII